MNKNIRWKSHSSFVYVGASRCAGSVNKKIRYKKPFKFCIRRSVTLYAECERYTGYSINKAFVHLRTRGSIMANDVRREANEDRLRRRERDRNRRARETSEERRARFGKLCLYYSLSSLATSCILNGIAG